MTGPGTLQPSHAVGHQVLYHLLSTIMHPSWCAAGSSYDAVHGAPFSYVLPPLKLDAPKGRDQV